MKDPYRILKHLIHTEKAVRIMTKENKLLFLVDKKAIKKDIRKAFEAMFNVKVLQVNTYTNPEGEKRAYIALAKQHPAMDIATKLGLI